MEKIGVFCSSHENLPAPVVEATEAFGRWMGQTGKMLVYGGVNKGLMEVLARAVKKNGGNVMGVIPERMNCQNMLSDSVDFEIRAVGLSDRKEIMLREADVFVALPGGLGTLDEIFTVMATAQVGEHQKRVFLLNLDGFWNPLIHLLRDMEQQGYAYPGLSNRFILAESAADLTQKLEKE